MASHSQEDTHNTAPSSESLDLLSPADLVEDSPLFKLPPELRNRIYGHVFGPSRAVNIVRPCWEGYWESQFEYPVGNVGHTSLFAVNRFVKAEAMDVLYGTKVVRGNDLNLQDMLGSHDVAGRVRSIEMTGCLFARHSDVNAAYFSSILRRLRGLSGLRSLVILSDDLSSIVDPSSDAPIPVMDFVKTVEIGPAMCTDIGQYRLHGEFEGVQIVNRKLVEMWPAVRATPEDYSGLDDALAIMASLQAWVKAPNIPTWASHSSLRCWVDIQQQYLEMLKSGKWNKLVRSQGEDGDNHEDGDDDDDDVTDSDDEDKYFFFRHSIQRNETTDTRVPSTTQWRACSERSPAQF